MLEYCPLGSLTTFLEVNKLTNNGRESPLVWHFLFDLLIGMAYMHGQHYLHLDVKPGNIFLASGPDMHRTAIAKLGDFGLAWQLDSEEPPPALGDGMYLAPELFEAEWLDTPSTASKPTAAADMFALGVTMFAVATSYAITSELWMLFKKGEVRRLDDHMSPELGELLRALFNVAPQARPSAQQVLDHANARRIAHELHRELPELRHPGADTLNSSLDLNLEDVSLDDDEPAARERTAKKRRKSATVKKDLFSIFNDADTDD